LNTAKQIRHSEMGDNGKLQELYNLSAVKKPPLVLDVPTKGSGRTVTECAHVLCCGAYNS